LLWFALSVSNKLKRNLHPLVELMERSFRAFLTTTTVLLLLLAFCRPGECQSSSDTAETRFPQSLGGLTLGTTTSSLPSEPPIAISPMIRPVEGGKKRGVDWDGLLKQTSFFLAVEQGYRIGTQPNTRSALKGEFFDDWFKSVASTNGWGDGDDFLTNYIGHPMMGSVTGHIYVNNDPAARKQTFSWDSSYWNGRLKGMAWSAVYSTQFELGPISEASIGNVGNHGKSLSGFVDLVVTPIGGLGWQVGEDILDKYLVAWIETRTNNRWILVLSRSFLNPTRSFANMMRFGCPWNRETRPGVWYR